MKSRLQSAVILSGLVACSAIAQETNSAAKPPQAPDKFKVSYALGMRLGLQLKHVNADVDADVIAQAIKDVMAGKPTKIQQSEIQPLFTQAQAYGLSKQSEKNKAEGAAFLARNAKAPGVKVLPDGLQYRIIKEGTGEIPKTNDIVVVRERLALTDGTEIEHDDGPRRTRVSTPIRGRQEALQRMKVGSKWEIFVPSDLAYGHKDMLGFGPDLTLIYELELLSIAPSGTEPEELQGTRGMEHPPGKDGKGVKPKQ